MSDIPPTTTDAPANDNHPPAANDNAKAAEGAARQNPEAANDNAKAADEPGTELEASQNGGKTTEGAVATRDPMAGAGADQAKTPQPGDSDAKPPDKNADVKGLARGLADFALDGMTDGWLPREAREMAVDAVENPTLAVAQIQATCALVARDIAAKFKQWMDDE